jgi:D-sedoheptulose 7-phosphate isomerase
MTDLFAQGIEKHLQLAGVFNQHIPVLKAIAQALINALEDDKRIYILGNGGSAADAQHIAAELVGRFKRQRRGLPAIALTTDSSNLLSIGNDYGFGHVFTRQVEALVRPGDVVWALSTSGNSPNIIEAVLAAQMIKAVIIGFSGQNGGKLRPLCEHCLCIEHDASDRIQEMHCLAYHLICDAVEDHFYRS